MDLPQIVKCVNPDCQAPIQAGAIHCPRCGASQLKARSTSDDGTRIPAGVRPASLHASPAPPPPAEEPLCWDRIECRAPAPMRGQAIYRARVPGGWLVACVPGALSGVGSVAAGGSLAFVPDAEHRWAAHSAEAA